MSSASTIKIPTAVQKGTPVPSTVTSPAKIRAAKLVFSQDLARDIENLSQQLNALHTKIANSQASIPSGLTVVLAPTAHSSSGTPGQAAYDASGNFYFCYAANSWARMGPGGFSNSF